MSAQQAGAASEHSVPQRNETQPNTPPDTKSNTRVPGTMGGRFFMEMGLKIQIQTSQPETSNSPSHSRTQRLGSLLGSSCWHTKVLEYLPAPNLQGADVALVLPAEAGKENALCRKEHRRNGRATKHTQKKTWGVAVSRVEDALGSCNASPVTSVNGGSCDIEKNAHSQAHQNPHLLLLKYNSRRI